MKTFQWKDYCDIKRSNYSEPLTPLESILVFRGWHALS